MSKNIYEKKARYKKIGKTNKLLTKVTPYI